jgi:hypothetical protein
VAESIKVSASSTGPLLLNNGAVGIGLTMTAIDSKALVHPFKDATTS